MSKQIVFYTVSVEKYELCQCRFIEITNYFVLENKRKQKEKKN